MQWTILDCTLRDGGYYTNWDFQRPLVEQYARTLNELPVEYLEVGYRNSPRSEYMGEFYYLPQSTLRLFSETTKLAVMLDAKNCTPDAVPGLLADCQGTVDLVRMAVDPAKVDSGIALAKAVKAMGFKVALNLMYLSKLGNDYSVLANFEPLDDVVDYMYLVDSYGACYPQQVKAVFEYAKATLPQKIGFHGHDNINLAFANSLAALEAGADIVDSTVLGMGRGAGNLRTELIVAYLAQLTEKQVDLSSLADLLETFQEMKDYHRWGAELPYVVSGLADLPQKEVMEWLGKKRYSTSTVVQTLQGKQQETLTSEPYPLLSERREKFSLPDSKTCIIIGGGATAANHASAITEFANQQRSIVVQSSLRNAAAYEETNIQQILCLPGREATKLKKLSCELLKEQFLMYVLATESRMTATVPGALSDQTVEVAPIMRAQQESQATITSNDSPLGIALGVAQTLDIENIFLVGFDGYPKGNEVQRELAKEVQELLETFKAHHPHVQLQSLTPSRYNLPQQSIYALLSNG